MLTFHLHIMSLRDREHTLFVRLCIVFSSCMSLSIIFLSSHLFFFFFFQAEDGIRDHCVTGVQTCALPICISGSGASGSGTSGSTENSPRSIRSGTTTNGTGSDAEPSPAGGDTVRTTKPHSPQNTSPWAIASPH